MPLPDWLINRPRPKGLAEAGTYTEDQVARVDGYIKHIPPGPGIPNLEATGHRVEVQPKFVRGSRPHAGRGAKD